MKRRVGGRGPSRRLRPGLSLTATQCPDVTGGDDGPIAHRDVCRPGADRRFGCLQCRAVYIPDCATGAASSPRASHFAAGWRRRSECTTISRRPTSSPANAKLGRAGGTSGDRRRRCGPRARAKGRRRGRCERVREGACRGQGYLRGPITGRRVWCEAAGPARTLQ